jgi:transposase
MLTGVEAPQQAGQLPAIQALQAVWQQRFEEGDDGLRWRAKADKPPAAEQIVTPHDPEARFTIHQAHGWEGYQTHWTETCDAERPHLITHVATPVATTNDTQLVPLIHAALAKLELLPSEHLMDTGYLSADNIADSRTHYGVRLVGPVGPGGNWQAGVADGITLDQFELDWRQQIATCPQGHQSQRWRSYQDAHGEGWTKIGFAKATCDACSQRQSCTKSTRNGRQLRLGPHYEMMRELRTYQATEAFRAEYAARAGIEGTISAAVRAHGARRSRYLGQAKTATQALLTAIAINLRRSALWLLGERPGCSRAPSLTCLAPA